MVWEQVLLEGSANKSDQVRCSPSIADDGSVYIGSYYSRTLFKLNGVNGAIDAQINVNARLRYFAPIFGEDGTVYFGGMSKDGKGFYSVDAGLNTLNWTYKSGVDFNSTPAIGDDGTIYVGSTDGYISALNPDGTEKWASEYGSWTASAIAIGPDGTVYFSGKNTDGGVLIAYNPSNGTEKWRKQLDENAEHGGPAIGSDGTIYQGSNTDKMIAYNPDGTEKWTYTAKGNIEVVPAIGDDGNIYFGDTNGFFHIVDQVGKNLWKVMKLGDRIESSAAIGQDGIIYVAVKEGETAKVIALKTDCTGLADGGWPMYAKNAKHTGR